MPQINDFEPLASFIDKKQMVFQNLTTKCAPSLKYVKPIFRIVSFSVDYQETKLLSEE